MRAVLVSLLVFAVGCGKDDAKSSKAKPTPETAPEAKQPPVPDEPPPPPPKAEPIVVEGGFQTPESVFFDIANDVYYVSNINGSPFDKDGNGFISKVKPDGTIVELKWLDGLDAPKGMAAIGNTLYVADIDVVRTYDISAARQNGQIPIEGATFLNDVAVMSGVVYVSDSGLKPGEGGFAPSGTDAVWAIDKGGNATVRVKDAGLNRPNGLIGTDALLMVTFGAAELRKVLDGKADVIATLPKGALDGIVVYLDDVYVSSWECQCVYKGTVKGEFAPVIENVKAPAGIGWDSRRKRILIPQFEDNKVIIHPM